MLVFDDIEPLEKIRIYDKRVEAPPHYDTFAEFHYSYHYGDMYSPHLSQVEPLKVQCQHFLNCIQSGSKPQSSGLDGLQVVQILEAALESLKKGGARVELDGLDQEAGVAFIEKEKQAFVPARQHLKLSSDISS